MRHQLPNQKGQILVEMVLLLAIGVGLSAMALKLLQDSQLAQNLVGRPWGTLSGMIECGTWEGCKAGYHPASGNRILSYKPPPGE